MERFREIAPGVLVATSDLLTCTSTVVAAGDGGCLVIDPAVSVADLAALAADLDGAVFIPDAGVLVAGDMLSDIEIPLLDTPADDPLGDYRAGLQRLAEVPGVRWLVPCHGHVTDAGGFRRRLDADRRYLDLLAAGEPFSDPRCTGWQLDAHREQLQRVAELAGGPPG
jgi:glyoxylase-like metal-dependent hydrolase (beta-lactamase superfamily II)